MTQNVEQVEKLEQQVQEDVILKQVVDQFTEELAKLQQCQLEGQVVHAMNKVLIEAYDTEVSMTGEAGHQQE